MHDDPTQTAPLTEAELDRLGDFLASLPPGAMNVEMLDGFFSALHCTPDLVPPSVWLTMVWGEQADADAAFADEGQAREVVGLLMRHWNAVAEGLARSAIDAHDIHEPVLLIDEALGYAPANDWATGFTRGMAVSPDVWQDLLADEEHGGALIPMMMLFHEHDPDPEMRPPPVTTPEQRHDLIVHMVAGLALAYRHLAPARRAAQQAERQALTFRRSGAKLGRNDPCACGSGKKFKLCCGRVTAT